MKHQLKNKINNGGFVFLEFAMAFPLLILLTLGLTNVTWQISQMNKTQLADYGLESEAQYLMERITHEVRAAKEIKIEPISKNIDQIKIVYHTVDSSSEFYKFYDEENKRYFLFSEKDVLETQYFIPYSRKSDDFFTLYAKRNDDGYYLNPITGSNSFGKTEIKMLKYELDADKKILHITLEMAIYKELENLQDDIKQQKIKINTAVFIPSLEMT